MAVVVTVCCVLVTRIARAETAVREETLRRAVSTFLKQPTSSASKHSARTILKFAEESEDVSVLISRKAVPWVGGKKYEHREILLCAFIAGNVLSQLDSGVNANDPYSGLIKVFRVYRYLKKRKKGYTVPEVERLLAMHKEGKLMRYLLPDEE
jgi:hypothetical protein